MINALMQRYRKLATLDRFLINGMLLFIIWFVFITLEREAGLYIQIRTAMDDFMSIIVLSITKMELRLFGWHPIISGRILTADGVLAVKMIPACMAWRLIYMFLGFILIYPGNVKSKFWFIPLGILVIIFLNSWRVTVFALLPLQFDPHMVKIIHLYVMRGIMYFAVFGMWIWWVRKYSGN